MPSSEGHTKHTLSRLIPCVHRIMRSSWLVGTTQFFEVLKLATNSTMTTARRLITKCTVLMHHFDPPDFIPVPPLAQIALDTTVGNALGRHEKVGIMKIGHILHCLGDRGVLLVRRYGDMNMSAEANPTLVLDMLERAAGQETCQKCSNRLVKSPPLTVSHCHSLYLCSFGEFANSRTTVSRSAVVGHWTHPAPKPKKAPPENDPMSPLSQPQMSPLSQCKSQCNSLPHNHRQQPTLPLLQSCLLQLPQASSRPIKHKHLP